MIRMRPYLFPIKEEENRHHFGEKETDWCETASIPIPEEKKKKERKGGAQIYVICGEIKGENSASRE